MDVTFHILTTSPPGSMPLVAICRASLSKCWRLKNIKTSTSRKRSCGASSASEPATGLMAFSRLTTSLKNTPWQTLSRNGKTCAVWASKAHASRHQRPRANKFILS